MSIKILCGTNELPVNPGEDNISDLIRLNSRKLQANISRNVSHRICSNSLHIRRTISKLQVQKTVKKENLQISRKSTESKNSNDIIVLLW